MTQEEKSLLLQDLCARLPYGVKVYINSCIDEQNQMELFDVNFDSETIGVGNEKWAFRAIPIVDIDDKTKIVRPYLRPMSSMTEEERNEVEEISHGWFYINEDGEIFPTGRLTDSGEFEDAILPTFEYFLKNHIDYRGLIPKGLALEASEGMYKENN